MSTLVCVEVGKRRVFASALEWPGWSRSGKDEEGALGALGESAGRFAVVAELAGLKFPKTAAKSFEIVERLVGDGSTDFGVPGSVADFERAPVSSKEALRLASLVASSWQALADVAATAPAELRKGPRGGGRDRDKIIEHVESADVAYASKLGIRGRREIAELRSAIIEAISGANDGEPLVPKGWPTRYAARRIAWHALDHAWEIEDRS